MQQQTVTPGRPDTGPYPFPRSGRTSSPSAYSYSSSSSPTSRYATVGAQRTETLAQMLGWFSIGLGLAELLMPRATARTIGMDDERPTLLRAYGARELAAGVGILSARERPTGWLWARVIGDAMDLATLGAAALSSRNRRGRLALAAAAVAGVAALDLLSSTQARRQDSRGIPAERSDTMQVDKSIAINLPVEECYRFWREFENLPRFMQHLESVQTTSDNRSHWVAKGPAGSRIEWDAEVTAEQPNQFIAWHSLEGAEVDNAGTVRFEPAPGGRGTIVQVELQYRPPGGAAGAAIARLFGEEPSQQIDEDLRRFKQLIETGEIPTTVGQVSGPRSAIGRLLHKGEPG